MFSLPDLARTPELLALCGLLQHAEHLAMRCAAAQARLVRGERPERRLLAQQRHEAAHAALFDALLRRASPARRDGLQAPLSALQAYEARLERALGRGDLAASLIGFQVVLEGIGTGLFRAFDGSPGLTALRRLLLLQEDGHHRLGLEMLAAFDRDQLIEPAREYAAAGAALLDAARPLLQRAGVAAEGIDPKTTLPEWLRR
jgi:hypothetical protein